MTGEEELLVGPRPSRGRRYWYAGGVALLVAGVLAAALHRSSEHRSPAAASSPGTGATGAASALPGTPTVLARGLPRLGNVQLFVRAANAVLQLDFAAGTTTSTPLPVLQSTGPVTFLATSTGVLVRPLDAVAGYFVPDGQPARALTGPLATAAVLPGPDRDSVWAEQDAAGLLQVYVPTAAPGRVLPLPNDLGPLWGSPLADGSGYVLLSGAKGTVDVRPDGAHRLPAVLATGTVLAAGADRLLVATCSTWPAPRRCPVELVRLPDGLVQPLGRPLYDLNQSSGVVAPDHASALIYQPGVDGQTNAELVALPSGAAIGAPVNVDANVLAGSVSFSSDGRWAFLAGADGALVVLDARTGARQRVDVELPYVYQVAVRG